MGSVRMRVCSVYEYVLIRYEYGVCLRRVLRCVGVVHVLSVFMAVWTGYSDGLCVCIECIYGCMDRIFRWVAYVVE